MNYTKYIVSFVPGSSGRFVVELLDRIILQIEKPIIICNNNSTHLNTTYTGISIADTNSPSIFESLEFDSKKNFDFSLILSTHAYPNFRIINERFDNIGIILIKINTEDLSEVVINSYYKNKNIKIYTNMLQTLINNRIKNQYNFLQDDTYPDNCLVLNYREIYEKKDNNYVVLEKLKKFMKIETVPKVCIDACNQYIIGRDGIAKQFDLR